MSGPEPPSGEFLGLSPSKSPLDALEPVIVVHGGAGAWRSGHEEAEAAMADALRLGAAELARGGALDAVQAAVEVLEDAPVLNAGRGAVPTTDGTFELDAAIMDGTGRRAGAVAAVRGVRHPVALARAVLDHTPHALLAGEGARRLAEECGLELVDEDWFQTGRPSEPDVAPAGTVGAVALDASGRLAAATSTGGRRGQRAGRVGDAPLVGAGTFAAHGVCAVSATGDGEELIRAVAAHEVAALVRHAGLDLAAACDAVLRDLATLGGTAGLIAVDAVGVVSVRFTTEAMARGVVGLGDGPVAPLVAVAPGPLHPA